MSRNREKKCSEYRERLSPVEGHFSSTLLSTPLPVLLAVSNHRVLIKPWVVMQGDARVMAEIHMKPERSKQRGRVNTTPALVSI